MNLRVRLTWATGIVISIILGLVLLVLSSCSPAFVPPTELPVTPSTPTPTKVPTATLLYPEYEAVVGLVKLIEEQRFANWNDGHFDVIDATWNNARVVITIAPTSNMGSGNGTPVYIQLLVQVSKYMMRELPGYELRLLLNGIYSAEGPSGTVEYYGLQWSLTFDYKLLSQIAAGPGIADRVDWFVKFILPQIPAQEFAGSMYIGPNIIRWRGPNAYPTQLPTFTPRPRATSTPIPTGETR